MLDTDIFGPSIPTLMGLSGEPRLDSGLLSPWPLLSHIPMSLMLRGRRGADVLICVLMVELDNQLIPLSNYGVKTMSMGYLVGEKAPVVWRGLMVMKALQQLLHEISWGGLDVLVLDLPPGTGDTQLTITQQLQLDGAVVVSTPQNVALKDAVKGIEMLRKTEVRVLGMVQNMSVFRCPHCHTSTHVFAKEGVERVCATEGVELLADLPLDARICKDADGGKPTVVAEPESERARVFMTLAEKVGEMIML